MIEINQGAILTVCRKTRVWQTEVRATFHKKSRQGLAAFFAQRRSAEEDD
jgi:hypothetical protein